MARPFRILQTGTYNSANKGDAAMELCMAHALRSRFPDAAITISTPYPGMDRPFYAPFSVVKCHRRNLIYATLQLVFAALWASLRKRGMRSAGWLLDDELRAIAEADLVVDLSGDMLTEDYGPHVAYSHFLPILLAFVMGRPYAICAQSIGPFRWFKRVARGLLNNAQFVSARDEITYHYLTGIGVSPRRLHFTADLAFLLEPASAARRDELLQQERITQGKPLLGVSLSGLVQGKYAARNPAAADSDFVDFFAGVLDPFCARRGYEVLFVPHVTGPSAIKDDRRIGAALQARLATPVHQIRSDLRPEEIKALVARCELFMGARMHANIAALSSGVPTVAISYSHKTPGIMQALGAGAYVCDITSMTALDLAERLEACHQARAQVRETLRRNVEAIRRKSLSNVDLVARFLAQPDGDPS